MQNGQTKKTYAKTLLAALYSRGVMFKPAACFRSVYDSSTCTMPQGPLPVTVMEHMHHPYLVFANSDVYLRAISRIS